MASSNLIGNPMSLVKEIANGFEDLLTNDWTALGAESLLWHLISGTTGTLDRITRNLGDGISGLTVDRDY